MATTMAKQLKHAGPKKVRASATQEEYDAAVEGTLQPRNPVLPAPEGGRPLGRTLGLPKQMTWAYIFQTQERLPLEQRMTDAEITEFMNEEFPTGSRQVNENVAACRRHYNSGGETQGRKPKIQSTPLPERKPPKESPSGNVKSGDEKGRVALGNKFANRTVIIEQVSDTEVLVKLARIIPEREAWLYENPAALAAVRRGLAQLRVGEVSPGPDLEADAKLVAELED